MIRLATLDDIPALHVLTRNYSEESQQHRGYSFERTQQTFEGSIQAPDVCVLVADGSQGGIAACSITMLDFAFCERPQAIIAYFYVMPDYRGTPLARKLLAESCRFSENAGCSHTWIGANGMLDRQSTKMFENLCKKQGFEFGGATFFRRS